MPLDWSPLLNLVQEHDRFLLTTHVRPDGDALGSMLALGEGLRAKGKRVRPVVASMIPGRYDFLDPERLVERFTLPGDHLRDAQVVIVLDTGTWGQLGDFGKFMRELDVPKLVIDHHMTQDDLGAVRLVDTSAEANGRLVYEALQALQVPLSAAIASALFTAVAMDTGWFRHGNTTIRTMELAAVLMRAGANPETLYELLFEHNSLGRLKLMGVALERLQVGLGGKVAWSEIHRDDYEATGAQPHDSEELVNIARSVAGVEVGLFFMEQPRGGIKVSFRSRAGIDVARLAEEFGGGGHKQASGAILDGTLPEAKARILRAVETTLARLD